MLEFKHKLPRTSLVSDRVDWLVKFCTGKCVLDVGCVSSGLLEERYQNGTLLHSRLRNCAKAIVGVDVDARGVTRMTQLGYQNILAADLSTDSALVEDHIRRTMGTCDVIVCGEMVEHVPNAGALLRGVAVLASRFDASILVTVPSAFSIRGFLAILTGTEVVHPDHKYYFSWWTLKTLLEQSGIQVVESHFYAGETDGSSGARRVVKSLLNRTLVPLLPQLGEGLVVRARTAG